MPAFPTIAPTATEIYNGSRLRWNRLGIMQATDLTDYLMGAIAYITEITGRFFSDWPAPNYDDEPSSLTYYGVAFNVGAAIPLAASPVKIPLARQAVRQRTEQIVMQAQRGYIDTATDDAIQSMSVGGYSETRRDPTRRGEEKTLNTWSDLNNLLWALMTPDRYGFWLAFVGNVHQPDFLVEEVAWDLVGKDLGLAGSGFASIAPWMTWAS